MKRGFTKSWRKELESDAWLMPPIYHRVWYWLRQRVQYESFLFPTKGFGIWVLPGQRLTSVAEIADGVKWYEWGREKVPNKKTIMDVLRFLESQEMIDVSSNAKGTLISITNWHLYNQIECTESNAGETLTGQRSGYKKRIIKKDKEGEEGKEESLGGVDITREVGRLKKLHLDTCGLSSLPPIKTFEEILAKGKPAYLIDDVYQLHGGDIPKYRQRNIVEKLQKIRDGEEIDWNFVFGEDAKS